MTLRQQFLILGAVSLSSCAQIVLKHGMSSPRVQSVLYSASWSKIIWTIGFNYKVLSGIIIYVASMALWLAVLARTDVSQAYPFVGIGFLITLAFGHFFLGESVSLYRIAGTILVTIGIILVSIE